MTPEKLRPYVDRRPFHNVFVTLGGSIQVHNATTLSKEDWIGVWPFEEKPCQPQQNIVEDTGNDSASEPTPCLIITAVDATPNTTLNLPTSNQQESTEKVEE